MADGSALPWKRLPGFLPDSLWRGSPRSRELTPTLVQRYKGRHTPLVETWHESWEMILVFHGRGLLHAAETVTIAPSAACLVPPRMPHREASQGAMDTLWIGLQGTWLDSLPQRLTPLTGAQGLMPLAHQLWLCAERRPAAVGVELDGLARGILGRALRGVDETPSRGPLTRGPLPLDECIEYLHRHHARNLAVTDLATRFGCSERHFNRVFKQYTGLAPLRYLRRIRIENARKLMAYRQLDLGEIAKLVGYDDPAYFSRIFRLETGCSPTDFSSAQHPAQP